jgi:hypothetical protein
MKINQEDIDEHIDTQIAMLRTALERPDFLELNAKFLKAFYTSLIEIGFTEDQAILITTSAASKK